VTRPVLFVVLDGLGDDPIDELDGRTPLEAADTPHLDRLAAEGAQGLTTTVGEGIAPESDIAVMALLGYDPAVHHPGRGPVEAIGVGMDVTDGDLVWRCNFATVGEWPDLVDRLVGRDLGAEGATALADEVNREVDLAGASIELRATVGHRAALRIRDDDGPLRPVTNTDPAYERRGSLGVALETFEMVMDEARPVDGEEDDPRAQRAADLTNRFTRAAFEILDASEVNVRRREAGRLPANAILSRDAGSDLPELTRLPERFGRSFACFVEMPVEAGISQLVGMEPVDVPGEEVPSADRYRAWGRQAAASSAAHDVLYIHIKGPDIPAHDGDWTRKRDVIGEIDATFFATLLEELDQEVTILVTADHATSSVRAAHTDDPVPYLVHGGIEADATTTFGERAARDGALPHRPGMELMPFVLGLEASPAGDP
jgi:2,3-bisphosphoglycerate-independent phosphoglycerate mutase